MMQSTNPGRILHRELNSTRSLRQPAGTGVASPFGTSYVAAARQAVHHSRYGPRLARYFGNSAQFRLNQQAQYDLLKAEAEFGARTRAEVIQAS